MQYTCFKKYFFFLLLCGLYSSESLARDCSSNECYREQCCDDSCAPLICGCFNVQVQAGVAPIIWTQRDNFSILSCNANSGCPTSTIGPVVPLFEMPKFHNLFKTPWTLGGKIGYALSDKAEVYIEANYRQASGKDSFTVQPTVNLDLSSIQLSIAFNNMNKYSFYDIYLGSRYYFDTCWCDQLSLFLGFQVGVAHAKDVNATITTSSTTNTCATSSTTGELLLFPKLTSVAGGGNIGLDYCICNNLSLVLTVEFLAMYGGRSNQISFATTDACSNDAILPELKPNGFIFGARGTQVFFPVTLGLKYNF